MFDTQNSKIVYNLTLEKSKDLWITSILPVRQLGKVYKIFSQFRNAHESTNASTKI